ncbi:MAG: dihydroorotate dehydrogenase electron transfer subunit [Agathobacter sp.]|nr:dihydroorotate dehydrogenase electron transfer subunit [Agathobacter sp.]
MQKHQENATVVSQKQLGDGIFDLTLEAKAIANEAKAGQFVSVYSNDPSKLLPRPISLCGFDKEKGTIRLVYRVTGEGTGTEEFSKLREGDTVRLIGPLGNGFTVISGKKAFLIGGGIGVPPMLQLAKEIVKEQTAPIQVVMGYRDDNTFLLDEFKEQAESFVSSDNGAVGTKGTVVDAIKENGLEAEVIYACGPMPMLRALKDYAAANDMECFVSMEERMACGIGACLACVCNSKEKDEHTNVNNKRICKEGPVFNARDVEW